MDSPYFSIVIPLYNKGPYIDKTLESVLAQTFEDYEIIVVDDGSTDDGPSRVSEWCHRFKTSKVIRQDNAGVSCARNRGIREASGEYVAFLDADDWWEGNHLEELKALADRYPEAGMLGTAYIRHMPNRKRMAGFVRELEGRQGLIDDYFRIVTEYQFIYTSSISIPVRCLRSTDTPFPVGVKNGEDLDLWVRLALDYPVAYCGKVTVNYNCEVEGAASRVSSLSGRQPSLHPLLTLRGILATIDESNSRYYSILKYAESFLYVRTLYVCCYYSTGHVHFMEQVYAREWSRSLKNLLLLWFDSALVWRIVFQIRRVYRCQHFASIRQNVISYRRV